MIDDPNHRNRLLFADFTRHDQIISFTFTNTPRRAASILSRRDQEGRARSEGRKGTISSSVCREGVVAAPSTRHPAGRPNGEVTHWRESWRGEGSEAGPHHALGFSLPPLFLPPSSEFLPILFFFFTSLSVQLWLPC